MAIATMISPRVSGTPMVVSLRARATVATRAMTMPVTPKAFPVLAVSCLERPARAMMNSRAATMYAAWTMVVISTQPFRNIVSMRWVTVKPPKTLMLATARATKASTVTTPPWPI